jgi:hypothetical protein
MGNPEWDDERPLENWEYPDEDDTDVRDETPTQSCPMCGVDIYEDAVQCPLCGQYLTRTSSAWSGRPAWWLLLGALGILAVILTFALV